LHKLEDLANTQVVKSKWCQSRVL